MYRLRADRQQAVITGAPAPGPPQRVRQHGADAGSGYGGGAPREEIVATTFGVPVERLILVTGIHYQGQLDGSATGSGLNPEAMFDEQACGPRANDRLKALPAEPDR